MTCELREVVLRDKPASMLKVSPKGTVPVLVLADGQTVDESLDIMLWALRQEDPQNWLRSESNGLSQMLNLIERTELEFKCHLDRYKYANRYEDGEGDGLHHRGLAGVFLEELNMRLQSSPWLMGDKLSLADVAIAPFVRQFANTDRTWFDDQPWAALQSWLRDFLDSPLFDQIMQKYSQWKPGAVVTHFPHGSTSLWLRHQD